MLAMLYKDGYLVAIITIIVCFMGLGIYNRVVDFTADEMTEVVQGVESDDKGAIELLIDGLGEATKAIYRLYVGLVNDVTDVGDVGDGVDLLFGTFSDMTGIGFGSTFESFVDGFCNEMISTLYRVF